MSCTKQDHQGLINIKLRWFSLMRERRAAVSFRWSLLHVFQSDLILAAIIVSPRNPSWLSVSWPRCRNHFSKSTSGQRQIWFARGRPLHSNQPSQRYLFQGKKKQQKKKQLSVCKLCKEMLEDTTLETANGECLPALRMFVKRCRTLPSMFGAAAVIKVFCCLLVSTAECLSFAVEKDVDVCF